MSIRAVAQRYLDTAQLFVAMGGGWSNGRAPRPAIWLTAALVAVSGFWIAIGVPADGKQKP